MSIETLAPSVAKLIEKIEATPKLTILSAIKLVEEAGITEADIEEFIIRDYDNADCYGRTMVYDGGRFELMVMTWRPRNYSAIHDHGYTEWGVVMPFHTAHHNIFRLDDMKLSIAKQEIVQPHQCIGVPNELIHQMGNPTTQTYSSLHLYGCNKRDHDVTADSKIYELEKNRIVHTTGGAFFNLAEDLVYDIDQGLTAESECQSLYNGQLLDYFNRQTDSPKILDETKKIFS